MSVVIVSGKSLHGNCTSQLDGNCTLQLENCPLIETVSNKENEENDKKKEDKRTSIERSLIREFMKGDSL